MENITFSNTQAVTLLMIGAFIIMLFNIWARKGPLAIVGGVAWFIVSIFCISQYRAGAAGMGIWTWAFAFVALLCSIFTFLTPKIFANPAIQDKTDEFDEAVAYKEDQQRQWKRLRGMGTKKKKEEW